MDNLNIKGIQDDAPRRRGKVRGTARKPFAVECRIVYPKDAPRDCVFRTLGLGGWWVHGRYESASRRDQAYAALVKKEDANRLPNWGHWEFRKRDD